MILHGDCLDVLPTLAADSVDAIVTDPPYGLGFMGKAFDTFKASDMPMRRSAKQDAVNTGMSRQGGRQRACADYQRRQVADMRSYEDAMREVFAAALRVAKPGAHLLAFGGTRTLHRLACAIEDAGWEIRDTIMWVYGSGFPKSLDVSKAIDKAAGAERMIVGQSATHTTKSMNGAAFNANGDRESVRVMLTSPATDAARLWEGWGTALKPAYEPIIVARKPLVGTVAANVLQHGTGAINVDACRVGTTKSVPASVSRTDGQVYSGGWGQETGAESGHNPNVGRWPANLIHDGSDEVVALFPADQRGGGHVQRRNSDKFPSAYGEFAGVRDEGWVGYQDAGSAARFFYCAKASRSDRGADNTHPTVKPTALMRYLCRLVTPPNGVVLDPFAGSGSTGKAAVLEGFQFIGIEREAEYVEIARRRIEAAQPAQQRMFA